jgi:hypothetical protein
LRWVPGHTLDVLFVVGIYPLTPNSTSRRIIVKSVPLPDRTARLNLKMSAKQRRDIEEAAKIADVTLSQFIRRSLARAAAVLLRTRRAA